MRLDLTQPGVAAALLGAQVAVIALVTRAVPRIGRHILVDRWTWAIALVAGLATLAGISFWFVLPVSALAYVLASRPGPAGSGVISAEAVLALLVAISVLLCM